MDSILDRANARAEAKAQARFQAKAAVAGESASTRYEPIVAPPVATTDMGEVVKQAILHIGESADENAALMRNLVAMLMDSRPQPTTKWVVKVVPETTKDSIRYGMAREYIFTAE